MQEPGDGGDPSDNNRRIPCGRVYGYHGCLSLLPDQGKEAGDLEGSSYRGICSNYAGDIWDDSSGGCF